MVGADAGRGVPVVEEGEGPPRDSLRASPLQRATGVASERLSQRLGERSAFAERVGTRGPEGGSRARLVNVGRREFLGK